MKLETMADYETFLSKALLENKQHVTYRLLARALKVHVNQAKEMLYEYHSNNSSPSVQATYLVSGVMPAKNGKTEEDEDEEMPDSTPHIPITHESTNAPRIGFIITSQDSLEDTKAQFSEIRAIHVYSLGPTPVNDGEPLAAVKEVIRSKYTSSDPLGNQAPYGGIVCKSIKHQTGKLARTHAAPTLVPIVSDKKSKTTEKKTVSQISSKAKEEKPTPTPAAESSSASKPSKPLQKRQQADFFKSFGSKDTKKSVKKEEPPPKKEEETSQMQLDSDSEEDVPEPPPQRDEKKEAETRARKKKEEEELAHMFDDIDEDELKDEDKDIEMEEAPPPEPAKKGKGKQKEVETPAIKSDTSPESSRPQSSHSEEKTGEPKTKKRGRRLVTKSVTRRVNGYLETSEEKVWESCSEEEEPSPPVKKPAPVFGGAKKPATKGQGNIMSFFQKK